MATTYTPAPQEGEIAVMSWLDHARELRNRLVKACLAVLVGLLIGMWLISRNNYALVDALIYHFTLNGLQAIRPAEAFTNVVKLGLGIGVALAMPVIIYQILAFVVPALTHRERRIIFIVLPFVILCFIAGLMFGWFITIPTALKWLLSFGPASIESRPTVEYFLSFFVRLMLVNGVLFELPVLVYGLIWLGVVERRTLTRYRRYSILVIVILSAIITPTSDLINLSFTAIPMYLLYELGLLLALVAPRKRTTAPAS